MSPARERWYRLVFWTAAGYDIALGIAFLFFAEPLFSWLDVADALPESGSYVALIAAFLFVIGVAYALIAMGDLYRNRDLITVGVLYKVAYVCVATWFFLANDYPHIVFFLLFGAIDAAFAVAMAECRVFVGHHEREWMDGQLV